MKLYRYVFSTLFAVLLLVLLAPLAVARDRCGCAGFCPGCDCGCAFAGPGILQSQAVQVGVPGPIYRAQGSIQVGIPQTVWIQSGNSREYRSSRSDRRARGGSRLSGHSTDHWSQQLNWGRP